VQPELTEYYWELERPPFDGSYDKIGLHRVVNENVKPKAAVFVCPGTNASTWRFIGNDFLQKTIDSANKRLQQSPEKKDELMSLLNEIGAIPERLIIRFLAANGYDVYGMNYRTHYIPSGYEAKDLKFMNNWGWDLFVEDAKTAIEKTKKVSGFNKVFIAGTSFGGMLSTTYASKYWKEDLKGIILLDGGNGGRWKIRIPMELWKLIESEITENIPDLPEWSYVDGRMTPRLLQGLIDTFVRDILYDTVGMNSIDMQMSLGPLSKFMPAISKFLNEIGVPFYLGGIPHYNEVTAAAFNDPLSAPIDPVTEKYLEPYNCLTNEPLDNYLVWNAESNYLKPLAGLFTNYREGYNTPLGVAINFIGNDRFWPLEVYLETIGMFEFEITTADEPLEYIGFKIDPSNVPAAISEAINLLFKSINSTNNEAKNVTNNAITIKRLLDRSYKYISQNFDYLGDLKKIDVPLISFQSRLGLLFWGPFNPGIKSKDVTNGGEYPEFGHMDIYTGTKNPEFVNIPTLKWLNDRVK
jgi:pimeloyl-ACP methyl ester carboxylesterase